MEREHAVAVLSRLHRAQADLYAGGADTGVRMVLAPDVVWHVPGENVIAGDYRGIDRVLGYFRRRRDLACGRLTMIPRGVLVGPGDLVAAITDGAATLNAQEHTWSTVGMYRISGERVAECWLLPFDPQAFDAIWAHHGRAPDLDAATASTSVFHAPVRPRHCDAQGVLHASRYYEYFEDAFLDWLDTHIGGYAALRGRGSDLVVVASGCEHYRGAALTDRLAIEVRPVAAGRTSLSIAFTVQDGQGVVVAVGRTTYVSVSAAGSAIVLPEPLRVLTDGLPERCNRRHGFAGAGAGNGDGGSVSIE